MNALTTAQRSKLKRMHGYRAVVQFQTGAVLVVAADLYDAAKVIDADGKILSFSHYLSHYERRRPAEARDLVFA
jgi:hypothetical protein